MNTCPLHNVLVAYTFVGDGHFERYANNSHKVFSRHQRTQDGTNTQSFTFTLVNELEERKGEVKTWKMEKNTKNAVIFIQLTCISGAQRPNKSMSAE